MGEEKSMGSVKRQVRVSQECNALLVERAESESVTISAVMIAALDAYLQSNQIPQTVSSTDDPTLAAILSVLREMNDGQAVLIAALSNLKVVAAPTETVVVVEPEGTDLSPEVDSNLMALSDMGKPAHTPSLREVIQDGQRGKTE